MSRKIQVYLLVTLLLTIGAGPAWAGLVKPERDQPIRADRDHMLSSNLLKSGVGYHKHNVDQAQQKHHNKTQCDCGTRCICSVCVDQFNLSVFSFKQALFKISLEALDSKNPTTIYLKLPIKPPSCSMKLA